MGKVILFSPVGGTDPVSNSNGHDGALIHCCRVYKPDEVYMYMSKYALEMESEDNRYTYCLIKLYESLGKPLNYKMIERPDLVEVQEFDFFYDDFKAEIQEILRTMSEGDTLLLNTSSGTPAMKSALVVLATLGDIDGRLIQVTTPDRAINKHDHDNYDVQFLWEYNPDNSDEFVNRCKDISCPSIVRLKNEELIRQFLDSYDYSAALNAAQNMNSEDTKNYIHLLEFANYRSQLDYTSMSKVVEMSEVKAMLPVLTSKYRNTVEYALSLFIKAKQGNYADFLRGLTPLILELFILALEKQYGFNSRDYCFKDKYSGGYRWDMKKLKSNTQTSEWVDIWNNEFPNGFREGFIVSRDLLFVIRKKCNSSIVGKAELLREVEENARNSAAHEIGMVTADTIRKMTGHSYSEIIGAIKSMFKFADVVADESKWDSYEHMNEAIIQRIGSLS